MSFLRPYSPRRDPSGEHLVLTTSKGTADKWWFCKHTEDKDVTPGKTWVFTDGSSSGWHAAVIIEHGLFVERRIRKIDRTSTANVGAEINGFLLGLEYVIEDSELIVVSDYIGIGAWMQNHWFAKNMEVVDKLDVARNLIAGKNLTVRYIHHSGHQDKKGCTSDFTRWNCEADGLCNLRDLLRNGFRSWKEELR